MAQPSMGQASRPSPEPGGARGWVAVQGCGRLSRKEAPRPQSCPQAWEPGGGTPPSEPQGWGMSGRGQSPNPAVLAAEASFLGASRARDSSSVYE